MTVRPRHAATVTFFLAVLLAVTSSSLPTGACSAQEPGDEEQKAVEDLAAQLVLLRDAQDLLQKREYVQAGALAKKLSSMTKNERVKLNASDILLQCGLVKESLPGFDAYAKAHPDRKPFLWQRGIALYFVERYKDGVEQFEIHREVNPNDVENAAWHYLCLAKHESPEKADQEVLPAPNDPRPTMEQVLQMFKTGNTKAVQDEIDRLKDTPRSKTAQFYGYFYLGLYADAKGKTKPALEYMTKSADVAPANYMGHIAEHYKRFLTAQLAK